MYNELGCARKNSRFLSKISTCHRNDETQKSIRILTSHFAGRCVHSEHAAQVTHASKNRWMKTIRGRRSVNERLGFESWFTRQRAISARQTRRNVPRYESVSVANLVDTRLLDPRRRSRPTLQEMIFHFQVTESLVSVRS